MRIGKWNIDSIQLNGMFQFTPVSRDHVGCSGKARSTLELRHDFAPGETLFGATRVLGIGQHMLLSLTETYRLLKWPCSIGVEGDARFGKTLRKRNDSLHLLHAR